MNTTKVIDFLVDQGELVDESITVSVDKIIKYTPKEELKDRLLAFFKKFFPDVDTTIFFSSFFVTKNTQGRISILKSHEKTPSKRSVQDFVKYFNIRFKSIETILKSRSELTGLTSISRVKQKSERESVSIIGMILEKNETKNGHIILTLEDLSGTINVLINKDNKDLLEIGKDLSYDEVIGVVGSTGGDIIFSNSIVFPDIPLSKELKKSPYDHYAVFLSDLHAGSNVFLKKEIHRVLLWLNGKIGSPAQREIAAKTKYLFVVGDLIEGVGIYPGQENDLELLSCKEQYDYVAELFEKIPKHIKIIICPGNHDIGRIAEPQLPIPKEYASKLWDMENVIMVSNPSYVSIDVTDEFSGIDVLLYHGYSLIYYSDAVPSIRSGGGQKLADDIMVYLLKRRHLAPSHGSTLYVPDTYEDPLVIDPIPDIFATGHIHRAQSKTYRNVTCINCSGWGAITEDQEKRGLEPQPGRVIAVSLKTREVKFMNFNTSRDVRTVAERLALEKESALKQKSKEEKS